MIIDAVDDLLFLLGERAEHLVPDDQKLAEVLVEIREVDAVVDAMMRGRREIFFKPSEFADELRVMQERDE